EVQGPHEAAVPVGQRVARVHRRPPACLCFPDQRLVVLLRSLERIRADNRFARVVADAMTPGGGGRVTVLDGAWTARVVTPGRVERDRAVAAVVALVHPEVAIEIEILRGEDVALKRLYAGRCLAAGRRGTGRVVPRGDGADELVL